MAFRLTPQRKPKLTENDVERGCVDYLMARGWYAVRLHAGLFRTADHRWLRVGTSGLPDYVCVHRCYPAFFMETKAPGKRADAQQITKHRELREAYRLAVVTVDSVGALVEWLASFEEKWR